MNFAAFVLVAGVVLIVGVAVAALLVWARRPGITLNQRRGR